ncbi:MAG: hypothetical protein C0425_01925 [Chlorobiaceae bacterium]|nr:hypothetical protein [Chlorobiaceae bacterium]MBA4309076.1 hypothetical protein [Chlorobiaceae bacterium]
MKNKTVIFLFLFLSSFSFSQFKYPSTDSGEFGGGLGMNWIDGDPYFSLNFSPEISFANFGVGLDLRLDFNKEGKIRTENFNDFSDYLSLISYIRYGIKNDPVFIKLGKINYYSLGHGSIMHLYRNTTGIDNRKIGLVTDINFGAFGFESIYSNFAEASVFALRGFVNPLKFTPAGDIPIIGNLEVGASYASDFHKNSGITGGSYNTVTEVFNVTSDEGAINIIGVDVGLPIINTSMFGATIYFDAVKIINFGSGTAAGLMMNLNGLGAFSASMKLERRWNGENYIPSYFNSFYELERFNVNKSTGSFSSKALLLKSGIKSDNGIYGALGINFLGLIDVFGSYQRLDKAPNSGILNLVTDLSPENLSFVARAGYDKRAIKDENDLFKLDDRSTLYAEVGYKPLPYLLTSIIYIWTFTPLRGDNDDVIGFVPQKRIEPRVSFIYPFSF